MHRSQGPGRKWLPHRPPLLAKVHPLPGLRLGGGPWETGRTAGVSVTRGSGDGGIYLPVGRVRLAPDRAPTARPLSCPIPAASPPGGRCSPLWHVQRPRGPEVQADTLAPFGSSGNGLVDGTGNCAKPHPGRRGHSCTCSLPALVKPECSCTHTSSRIRANWPSGHAAHRQITNNNYSKMVNRRLNQNLPDAKHSFQWFPALTHSILTTSC